MSYLNLPRLTFAGLFEADVNTVNNDVRNYSVPTFEPRFQTPQHPVDDGKKTEYNGWWNPDGSNAFRLLDCVVTGAVTGAVAVAAGDPALALRLNAQIGRTSAKIVDLDPQFQFASALWCLRIELTDGQTPLMAATLMPASFRDIYFARVIDKQTGQPVPQSPGASARFTGTLDQIAWGAGVDRYPVLQALQARAEANQGRLGFSLLTYGYSKTPKAEGFTFGTAIGSIGPWFDGDPLMFARSRRFAPQGNLPTNINWMDGAVMADQSAVSVDFGNSLPMWMLPAPGPDGEIIVPQDLGPLRLVVLNRTDDEAQGGDAPVLAMNGATVTSDLYTEIGTLAGYDAAWLRRTGGIADFVLPDAAKALVDDHPLAILKADDVVLIRETIGGLFVRADNFIQRLDAAPTGWLPASARLYAMRYGKPYPGASLTASLDPISRGQGGDGGDAANPPQAPIPPNNVPADKISMPSAPLTAGADGVAAMVFSYSNPDNPRGYIDGQIYSFSYAFNMANQSAMPSLDVVAVHIRDAFVPPDKPSWATDIAPILTQYGNLYPIMSRGLFNIADYATVTANARLLFFAFTRSIDDANYMPATRDMSAGKMRMLVEWLAGFLPGAIPPDAAMPVLAQGAVLETPQLPPVTPADHPRRFRPPAAKAAAEALGPGNEGKTAAMRAFLEDMAGTAG